jgi:carbon monoxide dehydrogenase subunit G
MITIEETVSTSKTRPEVFAYVADFTNAAEWDPGVRSSRLVSGDGGVGSRYLVEATFGKRVVAMTYQVVEYEPSVHIVLHGTAPTVDAIDDIRLEDVGGRTRVVYRARFSLKGMMRVAGPLLRPAFVRLGRRALAGLDIRLNR